jgi:murein DD-endopeptidase MepM/ murein hydrolase activator NlpD
MLESHPYVPRSLQRRAQTTPLIHAGLWPLPSLAGRSPVIVSSSNAHADLAYARQHPDELVSTYAPDTRNGSERHFMPDWVPVLAAGDGVIRYCGKILHGYTMVIQHGHGWATCYQHLEHAFAIETKHRPRHEEIVRAGEVIGYVGAPSADAMKCLGFQLWQKQDHTIFEAVDPLPHLKNWVVLPWSDDRITLTDTAASAAI